MESKEETRFWPDKPYLDFSKAVPVTDPEILARNAQMRKRLDEISEAQDVMDRIERMRAEGKYPPAPSGTKQTSKT